MKILRKMVLVILFTLLLMPAIALAEGEGVTAFFTWEYAGTVAGATAIVLLAVQVFKVPLDRVWKIPTRLVVLVLSVIILICAKLFTVGLAWPDVPLILLNSLIVTAAAMGAYEATFARSCSHY